jgi:hypothetical protein
MGSQLTYSLESFIGKIKSPIICVVDGKEIEYSDGQALLSQKFDRYYLVSAIRHTERAIIVELEENKRINDISWIGEEAISFF